MRRAATTILLLAMLALAPAARAADVPLDAGETKLALAPGFERAMSRNHVAIRALAPAKLRGRALSLPVAAGSFEPTGGDGALLHSGGFKLASAGRVAAVRRLKIDTSTSRLTASVAGRRLTLARLARARFQTEGFDLRSEVKRLPLTRAAAARLSRALRLPSALRAGESLGSAKGLAEPSTLQIASGQIALGGPETDFSKLESIGVQMGIWGATQRWNAPGETYFLFDVQPTGIAPDASAGTIEGAQNDGVSMQIFASPPREMLLRQPQVDLASGTVTATLSPLSTLNPITAAIGTLDYSAGKVQVRSRIGAVEFMGLRVVANQFLAAQLNERFATPGMFQAGETFARLTMNLDAR